MAATDLPSVIKGAAARSLRSVSAIQAEILKASHKITMQGGKADTLYVGEAQWELMAEYARICRVVVMEWPKEQGGPNWCGLEVFIVKERDHLHIA